MFYSTWKQNGYSLTKNDKIIQRKKIIIGNDVFIGANAIILDGVTIGNGAIVGAGTVVTKNIPPYAIVAGSPMKIIRYRFNSTQIEKFENIKWWDFEDSAQIQDIERCFFDIDKFLDKYN